MCHQSRIIVTPCCVPEDQFFKKEKRKTHSTSLIDLSSSFITSNHYTLKVLVTLPPEY